MADPIKSDLASHFVTGFNALLVADPKAARELLLTKIPTDAKVQGTSTFCVVAGDKTKTSALGVINGILHNSGHGTIGMVVDESEALQEFTILKPR